MEKNQNYLDKAYISFIDRFLAKFRKTHARTASQTQEYLKHQDIAKRRDQKVEQVDKYSIWEKF